MMDEDVTSYVFIKHALVLVTMDDEFREIRDGALLVKGKEIIGVGTTEEVAKTVVLLKNVRILDLERKSVLLPGLISLHHHFYQLLTRSYATAEGLQLRPWLGKLTPLWRHVDDNGLYWATKASIVEMMQGGCTTGVDHCVGLWNDMSFATQVRAARPLGLRFHVSRGGIDVPAYALAEMLQRTEDIVRDAEECIAKFHEAQRYGMVRVVLAPQTTFSGSTELFRQYADLASRHPTVLLHTHLYESPHETSIILSTHEARPLPYLLDQCGWNAVGRQAFFAHCVLADDHDVDRMRESGVGVATCPTSNMIMGTGLSNIRRFHNAGIQVGLGLDGPSSSSSSSLLTEARQLMLSQRVRLAAEAQGKPTDVTFSARIALRMATRDAAEVLRRGDELGRLAVGYAADAVAFRVDDLAGAGGVVWDPVANLVVGDIGGTGCWMNVVNGQVRIWKGKWVQSPEEGLVVPNVEEIVRKVNECAEEIRRKAGGDFGAV